jgi:hypothetical protein
MEQLGWLIGAAWQLNDGVVIDDTLNVLLQLALVQIARLTGVL